jgi:hypothetical protein
MFETNDFNFSQFIYNNKNALLMCGFSLSILSIKWKTRGTKDFGYSKLKQINAFKQNEKYISWIIAYRTMMLLGSSVGLFVSGGLFLKEILSETEEFKRLKQEFKLRFPAAGVNIDEKDVAGQEFIKEILLELEKEEEYQPNELTRMISDNIKIIK